MSIPFTITVEDVEKVFPSDGKCPVLDVPFTVNSGPELVFEWATPYGQAAALPLMTMRARRGPCDTSPTLDKIRPMKGYVPGNIAVISSRANRIKNNETDPAVFRKVADWLESELKKSPK